jgi:YfiH family protein
VPAFTDGAAGVRHFFGTRYAPKAGALRENGHLGRDAVSVKQVHGTAVLVVDRRGRLDETVSAGWDAMATDQTGVWLTIRTADCVPVLVHDPVRRVAAAVHAGWRGTVAGIVPRTLATLTERFGSDPATLRVGIGPSIGACCYEVDEPVLSRVRRCLSDWTSVVHGVRRRRGRLDLRLLIRRQLQAAGVSALSVHAVNVCTSCHGSLFYSYRRDGSVVGTMVSGIMLNDER